MSAPANTPWTPERVDMLRAMWAEGKSAGIISGLLSRDARCTISRSAVIGKVHRLGLSGRATTSQRRYIVQRGPDRLLRRRRKPSAPRLWHDPADDAFEEARAIEAEMPDRRRPAVPPPDLPLHAGGDPVTITDLRTPTRQCRHIEGEPTADALYCGAAVHPGSSYCPHHHHLCWVPHRRAA